MTGGRYIVFGCPNESVYGEGNAVLGWGVVRAPTKDEDEEKLDGADIEEEGKVWREEPTVLLLVSLPLVLILLLILLLPPILLI